MVKQIDARNHPKYLAKKLGKKVKKQGVADSQVSVTKEEPEQKLPSMPMSRLNKFDTTTSTDFSKSYSDITKEIISIASQNSKDMMKKWQNQNGNTYQDQSPVKIKRKKTIKPKKEKTLQCDIIAQNRVFINAPKISRKQARQYMMYLDGGSEGNNCSLDSRRSAHRVRVKS